MKPIGPKTKNYLVLLQAVKELVIGRMGDRLGRKPAMILSFWLMGVAIAGLALTPPRSMIGVAAPALVIFFRMLQGFALGGEVGPTTAFLLEAAPPERRGFYTAFQYWTQDLSVLISGLGGPGACGNPADALPRFGTQTDITAIE